MWMWNNSNILAYVGCTKSRDESTAHLFCKGLPGLPSLSENNDFKDIPVIGKIATLVHQRNLHELERLIKEDWSMDLIEKEGD